MKIKMRVLHSLFILMMLAISISYAIQSSAVSSLSTINLSSTAALKPSPTPTPVFGLSAAWVNEGGDKVAQEELRLSTKKGVVINKLWNGKNIILKGAKNEVINFNLVLEAAKKTAQNINIKFDTLKGPNGLQIRTLPQATTDVFNWEDRQIELFYVRYLQIKGLSHFGFQDYDERHVPFRFRRPWSGDGIANPNTTWLDRPDHDKFYPEIAVPLELNPVFNIQQGKNQSIWVDIYIPKTATKGIYTGTIDISENGKIYKKIPVSLTVYPFELPDVPTAKTMVVYSESNVNERYLGNYYIFAANKDQAKLVQDRHFLLAHRHKISMIGDNSNIEGDTQADGHPGQFFADRLQGSFFSSLNNYDGPGVNVGNNVYSIGTYGSWHFGDTEANMRSATDSWVSWFEKNAPSTDYFLFLIDESLNYTQINTWISWILNNPGPGQRLKTMATINLLKAKNNTPLLDIPTTNFGVGIAKVWEPIAAQYTSDPTRGFFMYNGNRPATGSFMIEDDGVSLRELAWGQFKKKINRWFYWESTYYNDFQGGGNRKNMFQNANTFGVNSVRDPIRGENGFNYSNGDGVLFYPGTDQMFPADSYNIDGPIASLRLKYWRRGIQDHDYLTMAYQICPAAVTTLVKKTIPQVFWEYGVGDPNDPTWVRTDISWSRNPDVWENARTTLAGIISRTTKCK